MAELNRRLRKAENPSPMKGEGTDSTNELIALLSQSLIEQRVMNESKSTIPDNGFEQEKDSIDLVELFWHVMSKLRIIAIVAIIGTLIGVLYAEVFHVPTYTATSKIYILSGSDSLINLSDLQLGNALGPDYTEVFNTWEVSDMVRKQLNLEEKYTYTQLREMLTISIPSSSRVLYLTVTSKDAQLSADIANAFANCGKQFIMESMSAQEPNTFSVATVPSMPSTHGKAFYIALSFIISTVLAVIAVVFIHLLDKRPHSSEDVAKATGLPVLTVIPLEPDLVKHSPKKKWWKKWRLSK